LARPARTDSDMTGTACRFEWRRSACVASDGGPDSAALEEGHGFGSTSSMPQGRRAVRSERRYRPVLAGTILQRLTGEW